MKTTKQTIAHEDLSPIRIVAQISDFKFGLFVSFFCVLIFFYKGIVESHWNLFSVAFALVFLALAYVKPNFFNGPKRFWLWLGHKLSEIVSPVVLAIIYFLVFTPFGFILRKSKSLGFSKTENSNQATYWKPRQRVITKPEDFKWTF
jgi:hypothetical protein